MVDHETMERILRMSRLSIEEGEAQEIRRQMERVLDYFQILSRYDLSDVDTGEEVDARRLRDDEAHEGLSREELERFAIHFRDGYFSVPRILDQESGG